MRTSWLVVGLILMLAGPAVSVRAQDQSRVRSGATIRLKPDGTSSWVEGVYRGWTDDEAIRVEVGRDRQVTLFAASRVGEVQVGWDSGPSVGKFAKVGSLIGAGIGTALAFAVAMDCESSITGCPGLFYSMVFIGLTAGGGGIIGAISGIVYRISVGKEWHDIPLESLAYVQRDQPVYIAYKARF